jgi:RNA polymerase sigma factor (sigma-70 family)
LSARWAAGAYTARMTDLRTAEPDSTDDRARVANVLVENHRAFLGFLERRVGDRALAEDLLQDAFTRNLDRLSDLPDEALVPWFYKVLRNAAIDRHRRNGAEERALAAFTQELADAAQPDEEFHREICACVGRLANTLKPEYAEVLRAVDVEETPVKAFAEAAGLTASNAGVRLFRAREALRKEVTASCGTCAEHGCLDCSCGSHRATH